MNIFRRYEQLAKAFGFRMRPFQAGMESRLKWLSKTHYEFQYEVQKEAGNLLEIAQRKVRNQLNEVELQIVTLHIAIHAAMTQTRGDLKLRGTDDLPDWSRLTDAGRIIPSHKPNPPRGIGKRTKTILQPFMRDIRAMILNGTSDGKIAEVISAESGETISRWTIMRHRQKNDSFKLD